MKSNLIIHGVGMWLNVLAPSVYAQLDPDHRGRMNVALSRSEFLSDPVQVTDRIGPSPAFVSESRRGWGMHLDFTFAGDRALSFFGTGSYERVPMGYRLDARIADHPGVPLPFDIQDLNLTTSFSRVSMGLGAAVDHMVGSRINARFDIAMMRHIVSVGQFYHQGVGASTDTTSTWVMGLDARVFQRTSTWHARARLGAEYVLGRRHSIGLFVLCDLPFGDTFSSGKVILFGATQYRTTLDFRQRGTILGLSVMYCYTWRGGAQGSQDTK